MQFSLSRCLVAEALGTGLLVATVVGSGIMARSLTADTALALLANTVATGAILVVLISMFAPVSGAHFNPAVSLAMLIRGELGPGRALAYMAVQIGGGVLGTMLAHAMFAMGVLHVVDHPRSGGAQWLSEGVATFGLLATILAGGRFRPQAVPWLVGLYISAAYWFTASTSFANPAVTIARGFTDTFSGITLAHVPAFILAQLAGAVLAVPVFGWLLQPSSGPET